MSDISGIHHVTAIAGNAQENLDFYTGVLGMRLVKKSVNQDMPGTYHLFFADGEAHPGTDITFFPWPDLQPAKRGHGQAAEISLAVPIGSLAYWTDRLEHYGASPKTPETRHGEHVLPFSDPHGLQLALVETSDQRDFTPWIRSSVPEAKQITALHALRLVERDMATTAGFLANVLGFSAAGIEAGWHRFSIAGGGSGRHLDILEARESPRGAWGTGGVHHVAWRVPDDVTQLKVRDRVEAAHRRPTPVIDRFWFHSVYFLEPGGVLFELATDGPGFTVDEDMSALGDRLVLPPWLEPRRQDIEAALPPLSAPAVADESYL
ncbi:MAG: ring-cleaving dioxygenase [Anaerolineae bacterium]|nr:ring-cleaving dioxygenase [Gemmatimonadaceae bacterium]